MTEFIEAWNKLADDVHNTAVEKGWWETDRNDGEMIALMHSELSEALEFLRKSPDAKDDHLPEVLGVAAEMADVVIRIMDTAKKRGWNVAEAIIAKTEYNKNRPYKHGGKKF